MELLTYSLLTYLVLLCWNGPPGKRRPVLLSEPDADSKKNGQLEVIPDKTTSLTTAAPSPQPSGPVIRRNDFEGLARRLAERRAASAHRSTRVPGIKISLPAYEEKSPVQKHKARPHTPWIGVYNATLKKKAKLVEVAVVPPSPEQAQSEAETEQTPRHGETIGGENVEIEGFAGQEDGEKSVVEDVVEPEPPQEQISTPALVEQQAELEEQEIAENTANEDVERKSETQILFENAVDKIVVELFRTPRQTPALGEDEEDEDLTGDETPEKEGVSELRKSVEMSSELDSLTSAMAGWTLGRPPSRKPVSAPAAVELVLPLDLAPCAENVADEEVESAPSPARIPATAPPAPIEKVKKRVHFEEDPFTGDIVEHTQRQHSPERTTPLAPVEQEPALAEQMSVEYETQMDEDLDDPMQYEYSPQEMDGVELGQSLASDEQYEPASSDAQDINMAEMDPQESSEWLDSHWNPITNQYEFDDQLPPVDSSIELDPSLFGGEFQQSAPDHDQSEYHPEHEMIDNNNVESEYGMTEPEEAYTEPDEPVFETYADESITRGGADSPYWMGNTSIPAALQSPTWTQEDANVLPAPPPAAPSPFSPYPSDPAAAYQNPRSRWTDGTGGLAPRSVSASYPPAIDPQLLGSPAYTRSPAPTQPYRPQVPAGFTGFGSYLHRYDQDEDEESGEEEGMGDDPKEDVTKSAGQTATEETEDAADGEKKDPSAGSKTEAGPSTAPSGTKRSSDDPQQSPSKRAHNEPEENAMEQDDPGEGGETAQFAPTFVFGGGRTAVQEAATPFAFTGIAGWSASIEPYTEEDDSAEKQTKLSFAKFTGEQRRDLGK